MVYEPNQVAGYSCSQDYRLLAELMRKSSIICLVDYRGRLGGRVLARDVARTFYSLHRGAEVFQVSGRGISFVYDFSEDEFIKNCEALNVGFIIPDKETDKETDNANP
ncbi:hypothetical protein [Chromobacterium violaceum]|uniref:hypothetical protein n=1 Tax=Chromobacterium violaceum TaxID=536 RepID=UPI0005BD789E|nr:hypothetical protein [Chromobacterium violaceum]